MTRRNLFLLSALSVALTVGLSKGRIAYGDRLGGSYRGPEDVQTASKDTSTTTGGDASGPSGGPGAGGESSGSSGVGGGGSSGDSGSGGSGSGEPGGSGGGSSGGSEPPASGGGNVGGTGPSDSGKSAGGSAGAKSSGGASGGVRGKGGTDSALEQLMVASWYFEHNREHLVSDVVTARSRSVKPQKGSVASAMSLTPRDARKRSSVTVEDREKIVDVLKKNTLATEDVVRDAAVIALGKVGSPDAVEHLKKRLEEESKWDIKEDILLALGLARTPAAVDALTAALHSKSVRLHVFALMGLGLTQDGDRAGPALLEFLNQNMKKGKQAEDAVAAAAMALGCLRYAKAEPALAELIKTKSATDVMKVYALQALGRIGGDEARKAIESQLDGSDDIARAALLALGNFPEASVAKLLAGKEGLGRPDQLGAGFAAVSLGLVLDDLPEADWKKLPDELRDVAMNPQKGSIRSQYANLALGMFNGGLDTDVRRRYADDLKNGSKLNPDVMSAMTMACGIGSVGGLESSLRAIAESSGSDPKLRGYAAFALGMTGTPSATAPALRSIYASASDNADVQRGAVLGMGLVGDRDDVPFLLDVIVKTDRAKPFAQYTRGAAVTALGLIRDGDSVGKIQDLLRNPDPWVRAYAVAALGCIADKDPAPVLSTLFEHTNFRQEFPALKLVMRTL